MRKYYASVGEWYEATKAAGFSVPVQMCHGLSRTMTVLNLSFPHVWDILERRKVFCLVDKTFFFDMAWLNLSAEEIIKLTNQRRKYES
ncbi:hypothetical protein KJ836_01065 [Patescibacteria group bacterium]|nr:hypothetical protein [Patescibacteria group bacterium]